MTPALRTILLSLATPFAIATLTLIAAAGAVVWNSLRSAGVTVVPDPTTASEEVPTSDIPALSA